MATAPSRRGARINIRSADSWKGRQIDIRSSADAKYKGKVVVVSGAIQNIGKDILGSAYIIVGGKGFLDGAQCTFTKAEESSVARLVKGQRVSVKGEVAGKMGHVQINKCSLQ